MKMKIIKVNKSDASASELLEVMKNEMNKIVHKARLLSLGKMKN